MKRLFGVNVYKNPARYIVCKISFSVRKDRRITCRLTLAKGSLSINDHIGD